MKLTKLKCPKCGSEKYAISQTHSLRKYYEGGKLVFERLINIESIRDSDTGGLFDCAKCGFSDYVKEIVNSERS